MKTARAKWIRSAVGVAAGSLIAGGAGVAQAADSKVELAVVGNTLAYDKSALDATEEFKVKLKR